MNTLIIAVDPGQNGGICEIWPDGKMDAWAMGDDAERSGYFAQIKHASMLDTFHIKCYLEQVGGFIGKPQPGSAMFCFGNGYGYLRGLLTANQIPFVLVTPRAWSKNLGIRGLKGPARKRKLKEIATNLYPQLKPTLKTADAILIAHYGSKQS